MKRKSIPQHEFNLYPTTHEPFALVPETAVDHDRLARESAQRERDRLASEQHQLTLDAD